MNKIFLSILIVFMMASVSSAVVGLDTVLSDTKLSNNVVGDYSSDATNATSEDGTAYVLSTANKQGNAVFASGSFVSEIYKKPTADPDKYASGDLMGSNDTFDSSIFDTNTSWEAL